MRRLFRALRERVSPAAQARARARARERELLDCQHPRRVRYTPEFSVGDESDYESSCLDCGAVLRQRPNR